MVVGVVKASQTAEARDPWKSTRPASSIPSEVPEQMSKHGVAERTEYLTRAQVAALLGVSPNTVARWARNGRIPCQMTLGGHRRFEQSIIEELLRQLRRNS
jgi:excisionase family DNA binding protein